MKLGNRHLLPRVADSASFLYLEHCRVEQHHTAIAVHDENGRAAVPCAGLLTVMLGPGTTITHAAVRNLSECGCTICWTGEHGVRHYAHGNAGARSGRNLVRQAQLVSHPRSRLVVVRRLYQARFDEPLDEGLELQQIRGLEGVRVREAYATASRASGIPWHGRSYRRDSWDESDEVNRAISYANSCLYGVCHAAIVTAGYSPALGFIHTGKALSFVYDIADLYKTETAISAAFEAVGGHDGSAPLERWVRAALRHEFARTRLLARIVTEINEILAIPDEAGDPYAYDPAQPAALWDDELGEIPSGTNYG